MADCCEPDGYDEKFSDRFARRVARRYRRRGLSRSSRAIVSFLTERGIEGARSEGGCQPHGLHTMIALAHHFDETELTFHRLVSAVVNDFLASGQGGFTVLHKPTP